MTWPDRVEVGTGRNAWGGSLLTRWRLLSTPAFGIKVHRINRPDDATLGPHNHPWPFLSITLGRRYRAIGWMQDGDSRTINASTSRGRRCWVRWVPTTQYHLVTHVPSGGAWTLVLNGARRPEPWGFMTDDGFVSHELVFGANAHNEGTRRGPR